MDIVYLTYYDLHPSLRQFGMRPSGLARSNTDQFVIRLAAFISHVPKTVVENTFEVKILFLPCSPFVPFLVGWK
jgi:hypothetical protein